MNVAPALGDPVTFEAVLERRTVRDDRPGARARIHRRWDPTTEVAVLANGPARGIVVGVRTLSNGYFRDRYGDQEFFGVHHFKAYLVAFSLRNKPVLVRPDHLR